MKTFRVPVVTDIQLWKYVQVEAESEEAAEAKVRAFIEEAANLEGDATSDNPAVSGLTYDAVQGAVNNLEPSDVTVSDLEWTPGIVGEFSPIRVDPNNIAEEVRPAPRRKRTA
jgi:hypothetical protein